MLALVKNEINDDKQTTTKNVFLNYLTFITVAPFIQLHIFSMHPFYIFRIFFYFFYFVSVLLFFLLFLNSYLLSNEFCVGVCDIEWKKNWNCKSTQTFFFLFFNYYFH